LRSSARRPTAAPRKARGEIRGDIERREYEAQASDHDYSRPNDLPRGDIQVKLRHPEIAGGKDEQTGTDQPAGVEAPTQQGSNDNDREDRKNTRG